LKELTPIQYKKGEKILKKIRKEITKKKNSKIVTKRR